MTKRVTTMSSAERISRRQMLSMFFLGAILASPSAFAKSTPKRPAFDVEIRVIEASNTARHFVDPRLVGLAPDLKTLPFNDYALKDHHRVTMQKGKRISFQFPSKKGQKKRFLVVTAHGEQRGGKLRFQFMVQALKFDTLVAVPNGGTILVGGPRNGGKTLLFAVTARKAKTRR